MQEYVRSGNMRHDTAMQAGYGHVPMVPPGGYGGDNSSYYGNRNGMPGQSGGFVPIDSNTIPTYLPSENERQRREAYETSNSLNRELSSYLSGGSLKPLDMSSQYRENWDNQFDPYGTQERSLNHHSHPSENRLLPGEEIPSWYTARQIHQHEEMLRLQQQQQHLNQNLLKPVKGGKGKKGKGKK
ncbi:uncharacterized protein LOC135462655 [Liolophura sinensis]|uniref:uncharacterized protein LOC135462655 n=1 Tax=Liolophura sinensis TaxID=3198878 RepID=UPI003158BABD